MGVSGLRRAVRLQCNLLDGLDEGEDRAGLGPGIHGESSHAGEE